MAYVDGQRGKFVNLTPPGALVDDASLTVAELDTKGYSYCEFIVILGATDIALTALTLTESDTTASGHANITASIWGTAANHLGTTSTLPSATDDDGFFVYEMDLTKRKRFIDATITVGDGTAGGYYTVIAHLSNGNVSEATAALRGTKEIIRL